MNERLEQEIDKWFGILQRDCNGKPVQEVSDWKETPDVMMSMNVASIKSFANHFYNLALADVRGEVIRLNNINKQIAKEKKEGASKWQEGVSAGYADIISFIDNLTK